jgi:hypothetical protein
MVRFQAPRNYRTGYTPSAIFIHSHCVSRSIPRRIHSNCRAGIQCLESAQLIALDQYLEFIQAEILRDNLIGSHYYCFILPFRKFLESAGDLTLMPSIRSGSVQRRESTRLGLFQCKAGCSCTLPMVLKDMERKLEARISSEPRALDERAAIKRSFARNDANARGRGLQPSPAALYQSMCLTSNIGKL